MKSPFFSIIVVAYNAAPHIRKTIESVLSQSFTDFEIVVKDAASTDGTLAEIPEDSRIRVYSERDGGIYDGMNAAIRYARGKYFLFLNCGDFLASSDVLSGIYEIAKDKNEEKTVIYGDYTRNGVLFKSPSRLTPFYLYRTPLCHQTVFFGRGVFERYEGYDTSYKIFADYNLTLLTFFGGFEYIYAPVTVSDYMGGGVSESPKQKERKKEEYTRATRTHFSKKQIRRYKTKLFFSFRRLRQKLISDKSPAWVRKLYRGLINRVNH